MQGSEQRRWKRGRSRTGVVALLVAVMWLATGCGSKVVIPAWLNVDPSQSSLDVTVFGIQAPGTLEGGIYALINLDLTNPLMITGTIDIPQIRLGSQVQGLGTLCIAKDPSYTTPADFSYNVLTGAQSITNFALATVTTAPIVGPVASPPVPVENVSFPLDLNSVTQILNNGEIDGALTIPLKITQSFSLGGIKATADVNAVVVSASAPPLVSAQLRQADYTAGGCGNAWAAQGKTLEVVVNSKGTYLRYVWDNPKAPRVINLAQIDAKPGDVLEFNPEGSFLSGTRTSNRMAAAFSSSNSLSGNPSFFGSRDRLPGGIDAGLDVITPRTLYFGLPTDISEDFEVKPGTQVTVPTGAQYLFFTPIDNYFQDNVSTDLRVQITVNP